MLKKLIKYDFLWINKFMLIYYAITFIVCILSRIVSMYTDTYIMLIIYYILRGCAISCFVSILINLGIRIWVRFNNNIYKDESYLTHTLPVSKNTIYNSKIITTIISIIIAVIIILINMAIVFLNKDSWLIIKEFLNNNLHITILLSILVILELIYMIFCGITSMVIGNRFNNHRLLISVVIGIAMYFFIQSMILGIMYIVGLLNSEIGSIFTSNNGDIDILKKVSIITLFMYLIINSILYFINKHLLNKGVNVD